MKKDYIFLKLIDQIDYRNNTYSIIYRKICLDDIYEMILDNPAASLHVERHVSGDGEGAVYKKDDGIYNNVIHIKLFNKWTDSMIRMYLIDLYRYKSLVSYNPDDGSSRYQDIVEDGGGIPVDKDWLSLIGVHKMIFPIDNYDDILNTLKQWVGDDDNIKYQDGYVITTTKEESLDKLKKELENKIENNKKK